MSFDQKKSGFGNRKAKKSDDGFVPEITRSSDFKKTSSSKSSFGMKKKSASVEGEFSRTSDSPRRSHAATEKKKPVQSSKSYAVWLLSRMDYSASALKSKIEGRGYTPDEVSEAMTFVITNKYQSDERFADHRSQAMQSRAGNFKVVMSLEKKGIDESLAKAQIENLEPEEDRAIRAAGRFKKDIIDGKMDMKQRAKIFRFLAGRGFSSGSVKAAMKSLSADALAGIDDFET